MKSSRAESPGFSLVEVVIAIGVFVAGVVGAIVLLSTTTDAAGSAMDANGAVRVAESSRTLVQELPWDTVIARFANDADLMFASRDGTAVGVVNPVAEADAFYAIRFRRLEQLSPSGNDAVAGYLAFAIEVEWPVRQLDGEIVPRENREVLQLNAAVVR